MQAWRRAFPETEARFLCVCVDGRAEVTAREFQDLYFDRDMINAFIDRKEDFPRFQTQLGCQGLVVVDAEGRFATQRSPAYLDHRNTAFEVVEDALRALAAHVPVAKGTPDDRATRGVGDATARSAENACAGEPAAMDDEDAFVLAKFPSVGHGAMDADHAEIERLMRRALDTCAARDVQSLTDAFRATRGGGRDASAGSGGRERRRGWGGRERSRVVSRVGLPTPPTTNAFWPSSAPSYRASARRRPSRRKFYIARVAPWWNTP